MRTHLLLAVLLAALSAVALPAAAAACDTSVFAAGTDYHSGLFRGNFEHGSPGDNSQHTHEFVASLCNATTDGRGLGFQWCGAVPWFAAEWNLTAPEPHPCTAAFTTVVSSGGTIAPGQAPFLVLRTADAARTVRVEFHCDSNASPRYSANSDETVINVGTRALCTTPAPVTPTPPGSTPSPAFPGSSGGPGPGAAPEDDKGTHPGVIAALVVGIVVFAGGVVGAAIGVAILRRPKAEAAVAVASEGGLPASSREPVSCLGSPAPTPHPKREDCVPLPEAEGGFDMDEDADAIFP